jgi:hypothetical protein
MSESNQPPGLPEIVDEATDTPAWIPVTGLVLLAFFLLLFVVSQATGDEEEAGGAAVERVEGR